MTRRIELKVGEKIPATVSNWFRADKNHCAPWRKEAIEYFDFTSGRGQWSKEDRDHLESKSRPVVTFNRTEVIIDAVAGNEQHNRFRVQYAPVEQGDVVPNEILSEAARWFDQRSEAEFEDSEAFRDSLICGMGWTETTLNFDENPDGEPETVRIDPTEMVWDCGASRSNLIDAKRLWRVRKFTLEEAREMFPDAEDNDLDSRNWTVYGSGDEIEPHDNDPENRYSEEILDEEDRDNKEGQKFVTIIHLKYYYWEDYYRVADPTTGQVVAMSAEKFEQLSNNLKSINSGFQLQAVKQRRKKFVQAFLGSKVLSYEDELVNEFSWKCITGKYDRSVKYWYGMVRAMKDPQLWANKWLAQLLHVMNSNSKGGIIVEEGVIPGGNIQEFEENWAEPDAISVVKNGAIAGGRIRDKQQAQFPQGFQVLTEFAIRAIREVSGVSLELLGLREMNQPGVLEHQRKQAGMAVLSTAFESLRRYRKQRGKLMLKIILEYLADGRLIRVVGKDKEQYVPLLAEHNVEFDTFVDDSPTSTNQKEMVWGALTQLLPGFKDVVPPKVLVELLEYSPIPGTVVRRIKDALKEASEDNREQQEAAIKKAMLELASEQADIEKTQAETQRTHALTAKLVNEVQERQGMAPIEEELAKANLDKIDMETAQTLIDGLLSSKQS